MGIVAIHGGLDTSREPQFMDILREAALKGHNLLGTSRIQALEAAIKILEDSPKFNCGYGSVLNSNGEIEMDAAIVDGTQMRFAAVAAINGIRNPISVARALFESTRQIMLAGQGAREFAIHSGIPESSCLSDEQLEAWQKARDSLARGEKHVQNPFTGLEYPGDTVGCVVWDGNGLAASSSTGGCFYKMPGRVGDTPSLGGGIYASGNSAVVCTGIGEAFVETLTAKFVDERITGGSHPQEAAVDGLKRLYELKGVEGGILAIDSRGNFGSAFNAGQYPVVIVVDGNVLTEYQPINLRPELVTN